MSTPKPKHTPTVFLFANGNIAVTDEHGEQIVDLQATGWITSIFDRILLSGRDPFAFTYLLPDKREAVPFRTYNGRWNWRITK